MSMDPTERADEPILDIRRRRSEKRRRAAMISIRLTADELKSVQAQANARGVSVSRYVRDRALEPARPPSAVTAYPLTNRTYSDTKVARVEVIEHVAIPTAPYVVRSDSDVVAINAS